MNELALFAGAGGGILGGKLQGWRTVCAVEKDPYARDVLVARQNDRCLDPFPIWDDVRTFNGKPWCGIVDVVSGGFPCQDISAAGKGAGIDGERSGLWREMARIIGEVRPNYVLVENSPMLIVRGLDRVIGDLAALGYNAKWGVVGAIDAGAPHKRDRIWILANSIGIGWRKIGVGESAKPSEVVAYANRERDQIPLKRKHSAIKITRGADAKGGNVANTSRIQPEREEQWAKRKRTWKGGESFNVSNANGAGCEKQRFTITDEKEDAPAECNRWWESEPGLGRVAHGVAYRVDRLRCIGNGQVPAVVELAWKILTKGGE